MISELQVGQAGELLRGQEDHTEEGMEEMMTAVVYLQYLEEVVDQHLEVLEVIILTILEVPEVLEVRLEAMEVHLEVLEAHLGVHPTILEILTTIGVSVAADTFKKTLMTHYGLEQILTTYPSILEVSISLQD